MLLHLALQGSSIGNRMGGVSNASRAAGLLKEKKLVTGDYGVHDLQPHTHPSDLLSLTHRGLIHALAISDNPATILLADHWKGLFPRVFAVFNSIGPGNEATITLMLSDVLHVLQITVKRMIHWEGEYPEELADQEVYQDAFERTFLTYLVIPPARLPPWHSDLAKENLVPLEAQFVVKKLIRRHDLDRYLEWFFIQYQAHLEQQFSRIWKLEEAMYVDPLERHGRDGLDPK